MESDSPNTWKQEGLATLAGNKREFHGKSECIKEIAVYEGKDSSEDKFKCTKYQSI